MSEAGAFAEILSEDIRLMQAVHRATGMKIIPCPAIVSFRLPGHQSV